MERTALATADLDAICRQLESEKANLEREIAELEAGREEAIAARAISKGRMRSFNKTTDNRLGELRFDLEEVKEALKRNAELRNDPSYIAAEQKRAIARQELKVVLHRLLERCHTLDTEMTVIRVELESLDGDCADVRSRCAALGLDRAATDFGPDVITAQIFGALSTHGLTRVIPADQIRVHGKTLAEMIAPDIASLCRLAGIESKAVSEAEPEREQPSAA